MRDIVYVTREGGEWYKTILRFPESYQLEKTDNRTFTENQQVNPPQNENKSLEDNVYLKNPLFFL